MNAEVFAKCSRQELPFDQQTCGTLLLKDGARRLEHILSASSDREK